MGRRLGILALGIVFVLSSVIVTTPASAATTKVATNVSALTFRWGESLWVAGSVYQGSKPVVGVAVTLRSQKVGSSTWKTVAAMRTSSKGRYAFPVRPTASVRYYVRTSTVRGPIVTTRRTVGDRTLEARAKLLGTRVGSPTSGVTKLGSSLGKVGDASVTSVRYRSYSRGMLVEVRRNGTLRTWFVPDKIRDRLVAKGGVRGTFGVPRSDANCTLIESGCTQQFSKVAAYASSKTSMAYYQAGRTRRAQYIATARSQVGYTEPSWRNSKYNAWVGANNAWCGVFQSWVAAASGNPDLVPRRTTYPALVSAVKDQMLTYKPGSTKHKPRAGTLAFFAFRNGQPNTPSHVGLILSVSGSTMRVIEGNSSTGSVFTDHRGVYVHTRYASSVVFYAEPNW
jgi:hypothetical protein